MKGYRRVLSVILFLTLLVSSGCGVMGKEQPAATEVVTVEREVQVEATMEPMTDGMIHYSMPSGASPPSTGGDAEPNDQPYGDVFFDDYGVNPRIDTEDDRFSTFAVDVDTGSYTVMRRYVTDGFLPPEESVRVEEYINFFDYDYDVPQEAAFAIDLEGSPSPYADNYHLVRVGLQGYEIPPEERKDVVLTFVIDVSGSMDMENRLELVKESLELLVDELRPSDKVGIVIYGSRASVELRPTAVSNRRKILRAIRALSPGGSTNAEEGLVKAYEMAWEYFEPEAINRVILCSDGVANVGRTGPDSIMSQIEDYAEQGIYLTSMGFGMGNYNDVLMEQLADSGDGFYAYVDDIKEAERVFVHDLTSSLQVIARDTKIQVEFNTDVISRYRLIGYENRDVADEDFRNNDVDAGEVGVGHSVTALYEVKFQPEASESELAMTVYVRYEDPDSGKVSEINRSMSKSEFSADFDDASTRFQLAVIVAQYAEVLRESYWATDNDVILEDVAWDASRIAEYLPRDKEVQEFADLVNSAADLSTHR